GGAEQVQAEWQKVELDRIENRRQILRTEFGRFLVAEPAASLNRAADELHWVREVLNCCNRNDRPVRRVVNLVDIRGRRRQDVQAGLQPVQWVGLDQRIGCSGEVVDVSRQHLTVLVEERPKCGQQTVELLYRVRQVVVGAIQAVGELGQIFVQCDELLVVL